MESISKRGLANGVNGSSFLCPRGKITELEDAMGSPFLIRAGRVRISPRFEMLSDGGDTVRQLQEYLHPCSEHLIDWFDITMRLTVRSEEKGRFLFSQAGGNAQRLTTRQCGLL
jgi:hypothetical protein